MFKHRKEDHHHHQAFIFGRIKEGKNNIFINSCHQCTIESGLSGQRQSSTPPHAIKKYELHFCNSEHIARYDPIASGRIIEPKYIDVSFSKIVVLWDNLSELIGVAGEDRVFEFDLAGL